MAQALFSTDTTPAETDLDANFSDLYDLRELISTPSYTAVTTRLKIDSSGRLGIGTTSPASKLHVFAGAGDGISIDGAVGGLRNLEYRTSGSLRWLASAGGVAESGSNVGSDFQFIRFDDTGALLATAATFDRAAGHFYPGIDNSQTLGKASFRWSVVYAGTGAINTSDAREKTSVTPLTANEIAAAKALAAEIGTYQWLQALQAKGADARTHIGMTVQRAMDVMTANSLDPMAYGFICHDSWDETSDGNGGTIPAGDRYGFRPDELLLFLARGFDARLTAAGF